MHVQSQYPPSSGVSKRLWESRKVLKRRDEAAKSGVFIILLESPPFCDTSFVNHPAILPVEERDPERSTGWRLPSELAAEYM